MAELRREKDEREVPGVVRLELVVEDEKATLAPDGWVLLQNARASSGSRRCSGWGSTTSC